MTSLKTVSIRLKNLWDWVGCFPTLLWNNIFLLKMKGEKIDSTRNILNLRWRLFIWFLSHNYMSQGLVKLKMDHVIIWTSKKSRILLNQNASINKANLSIIGSWSTIYKEGFSHFFAVKVSRSSFARSCKKKFEYLNINKSCISHIAENSYFVSTKWGEMF